MRRRTLTAALLALSLCAAPAFAWKTPARGSADRSAMMDAIRPHAEWKLGAPVEFVVRELRVQGSAGLAIVDPQRPGGGRIDPYRTPMATRDGEDPGYMDGLRIYALLWREDRTWVMVHWAIGPTDVWFANPDYCGRWAAVMPEYCG